MTVNDNLNPVEQLNTGIKSSTRSLIEHVCYTRNELLYGSFYLEMLNCILNKNIETILDIGGCTGEFTKVLMELIPSIKKSTIIEPFGRNYHFINYRFYDEPKVDIIKKCVYYGQDKMKLVLPIDGNVGGVSGNHKEENKSSVEEIVDVISIEELPVCDFVKIDVEGSEWRIIENSENLKKFKFIQIEFHDLPGWHSAKNWHEFVEKHLPDHRVIIDGKNCPREWGGSFFEQVLLYNKDL